MTIAPHAVPLDQLYALRPGTAPGPEGRQCRVTLHDLGLLRVLSGHLGACDPFVNLDDPVTLMVPPGDYPVRVTVADVSEEQDGSHLREAYLSVVLAEGEPARAAWLTALDEEGEEYEVGVAVDAGTVAFVDTDAVATCMPERATWYDDLFDSEDGSWFEQMDADAPLPAGTANIVMPLATAGENVVLSHSGWGDGSYGLIQVYDAQDRLLAVHLCLDVLGVSDSED